MPNKNIAANRKYKKMPPAQVPGALPCRESPENLDQLRAHYRAAWLLQEPEAAGAVLTNYQTHYRLMMRNPAGSPDGRFHGQRMAELERAFPGVSLNSWAT